MTKSTSPAANAGLPAIDRRSLVCGLGTAAVAGVPALAGAAPMSDDPVFQAMAALGQLKNSRRRIDCGPFGCRGCVARRREKIWRDTRRQGNENA